MRLRLEGSGFRFVSQVMEHGEFAVRGSLLDLFPMGSDLPYRIDLFDEQVDSIRTFDPETQRSLDSVQRIRLLPAREFPLHEDAITRYRQAYGLAPPGIEYYLPLFFGDSASLFDYLAASTLVIATARVTDALDTVWNEINSRYESLRHNRERPLLAPAQAFFPPQDISERTARYPLISVSALTASQDDNDVFATTPPPPLPIMARAERPFAVVT